MLGHHVLDLPGEHVEAAGDDHVLDAVDDVVEAIGVLAGQVAGVQPAVFKSPRRLVWQIPVTARQQRSADTDFADFALLHRLAMLV
ncbi:Uncharacterised protein [Mycobacterium tuberculosis]|uniref:Uncharacterized protein n=1 Tax=Mycobacterium tuberculosis TaxID=1773 RepID=A0A654U0L3_MYCTX|nr:Uncharacterised protein [Mycobacterium tuberculosis]CNV36293.1 Uncharacterised protein [Mycobacterium tuberculosis]